MNVLFGCTACDCVGSADVVDSATWNCPRCDHVMRLNAPACTTSEDGVVVESCAACGNRELYRMKAFPHWLGLGLLTAACGAFLILHGMYLPYWAWGILLGSAAFDGLLYLAVPDAATCYRCHSRHRGIRRCGNPPFELTIQERYRHEAASAKQETES